MLGLSFLFKDGHWSVPMLLLFAPIAYFLLSKRWKVIAVYISGIIVTLALAIAVGIFYMSIINPDGF